MKAWDSTRKKMGKKAKKIKSSIKRTAPLIYHELPRHIPFSTKSKFKYVAVVKMQNKYKIIRTTSPDCWSKYLCKYFDHVVFFYKFVIVLY